MHTMAMADSTNNEVGETTGSIRCYAASEFPDIQWFDETVAHPAISVPARHVARRKKQWKSLMLQDRKNVYSIVPSKIESESTNTTTSMVQASMERKILIMNIGVTLDNILSLAQDHELHNNNDVNENDITWIDSFPITRGYYDMSVDEALRKLLTNNQVNEVPSSFELVGHIAHINLRDDCLPYKYWIGRVILDLNQPTIQTVVNKIGTIESDNVFRTFKQEVIAGNSTEPDWSIATVQEHGCCFQLDFRHVYWNSRLSGEHRRLVKLIQASFKQKCEITDMNPKTIDETQPFVVVDLMAGVGPFAIPLTTTITEPVKISKNSKRQTSSILTTPNITVYANDLNPISIKFLEINSTKNKCKNLHCRNCDAREFLQELQAKMVSIDHVIMNLPASAPEFLDSFRGWKIDKLPTIHVYCFGTKCKNEAVTNKVIIDRCTKSLGCSIYNYDIFVVRNISPTKNMYCVSFQLPEKVRYVVESCLEKPLIDDRVMKKPKL
jgi:tRNA (guanine37-N1)-methyltransferase